MSRQERKSKQNEKKTVELKELAVTESLSITEMGQIHGGHRLGGGGNGNVGLPSAPAPVQLYAR
jgi:hypothetical protein